MNPEQLPADLQLLCDKAVRFHQKGNLPEAEQLYLQILAARPASFTPRHLLGLIRFQYGRNAEAIELIGGALTINPRDAQALTNYGFVLHAVRRFAEALESFDRALAVAPDFAMAWNNRGNTLRDLGRTNEALASFDRAVAIKPDYAEAWNNRGSALRDLGRHQDALISHDKALAIRPDYAGALYNRGNLLQDLKRLSEALSDYERALALDPNDAEAWNNRGIVLRDMKRRDEALASYDRSLAIKADYIEAWYNRGRLLQEFARFAEALTSYDKALANNPGFAPAWNNRGNTLRQLKRFEEALASYSQALAIKPDFVEAINNSGNTLQDLKRFDDALARFDAALAISPGNADAWYNRGTTLLHLKRMAESLASHEKALAADPHHADALGGVANAALQICDWTRIAALAPEIRAHITERRSFIPPFVLLGHDSDAALQMQCARNCIQDRIPVQPERLCQGTVYGHQKIRVAYLSSDFRKHPVAFQIVELLERHDRECFEIIGISLGNDDGSEIRARIMKACDQFHDIRLVSDRDAAELLRRLEVDIAIDLNGHTQDARPGIFAHRPVPVQVNYLGYAGTSGADFMDYIIADRIAVPLDQQPFFTEKIIHLPDSFFASDSKRPISITPSRQQAGLPDQAFIFGCFNGHAKITKKLFEVWMRLLAAVPGSLLWLNDDGARETLCCQAGALGIDPARLVFGPKLEEQTDHLARLRLADLLLDTLPFNAHSSASDALWAGVPLLTCLGKTFPGRVAASLLTSMGVPELIAGTLEDYEAMALALAHDPKRLNALREKMAQNRASSPLFDTERFRRNIEAAYAAMLEAVVQAPQTAGVAQAELDWNIRGIELWGLDRREEAIASFDKAVASNPGNVEAWNNRGAALQSAGRPEDALASYDKALELNPTLAEALFNRGNVLRHLKNFAAALRDYDAVLRARPEHAQAWNKRGSTLCDLKRIPEALESFNRALALRPDFPDALYERGKLAWLSSGRTAAAIADLEQAIRFDPDHDFAQGLLLHLKMHGGDWRDFERQKAMLDAGVRAGKRVVEPFIYQALSESPADLQKCAAIYADHLYPPAPAIRTHHRNARLRIGYVSGEFREQATALLAAGLYELHDRSRFEIFAFENGRSDGSPMRRRLETGFDKFVDISYLPDREAAQTIAADGIDILVNLNGYFGDLRMEVFARKPAPIQVNYLGFPGTLGASYMDYILADRFVIPEDERTYYTEKVVYLPDTYQVNDSRRAVAQTGPSRAAYGLPESALVFCNFNQSYKLAPVMFAVWMRILQRAEDSVLWLLKSNQEVPGNLRREAERHGVAGTRLVFAPSVPVEQHLARLQLADLFLDSLPYNAHTTASDALWAGLPLLTCSGNAFAGRVATSLLQAVKMPELVTENLEAYEALAIELAGSPARLQSLRQKLARQRLSTPLFDTERFRRNIESAYTMMWDVRQRGDKPRSFAVASSQDG